MRFPVLLGLPAVTYPARILPRRLLVEQGRARLTGRATVINAPVVPHGSTLGEGPLERQIRVRAVQGTPVRLLRLRPHAVRRRHLIVFVAGFDGDEPVLREHQLCNASSVPGRPGYGDLWQITYAARRPDRRRGSCREVRAASSEGRRERLTLRGQGSTMDCLILYVRGRPANR